MFMTTSYMERPAAMPPAAPMGVVGIVRGTGPCTLRSATHRAALGTFSGIPAAAGNSAKPWTFWMGRQVGLTTDRSARHLGRPST